MNWNSDGLWQLVTKQFRSPRYSVHGPEHWRRVERNGLLLATRSGADIVLVRLFALFHDSRRQNDGRDDGHGIRGAEYAKTLHGVAYDLSEDRFELLYYACVWHTDGDLAPRSNPSRWRGGRFPNAVTLDAGGALTLALEVGPPASRVRRARSWRASPSTAALQVFYRSAKFGMVGNSKFFRGDSAGL